MGVGAVFVSTLALSRLPTPHSPLENQQELLAATLQTIVSFVVLGSIVVRKYHVSLVVSTRYARSSSIDGFVPQMDCPSLPSHSLQHSDRRRYPTLGQLPYPVQARSMWSRAARGERGDNQRIQQQIRFRPNMFALVWTHPDLHSDIEVQQPMGDLMGQRMTLIW